MAPQVSVVMITRDRREELLRTLAHLVALPSAPEIVVVDNASHDESPEAVRASFPTATVIEAGRNLGAAARNVGARVASGRYIAFCDDDGWWAPDALPRAAAILDAHSDVALVAARVLVGEEANEDPCCAMMGRSPLPGRPGLPGSPVLGFIAGASVVRRDSFFEAGGFHPRFGVGGEEQLLAIDLVDRGWTLVYAEDSARREQQLVSNCRWWMVEWRHRF